MLTPLVKQVQSIYDADCAANLLHFNVVLLNKTPDLPFDILLRYVDRRLHLRQWLRAICLTSCIGSSRVACIVVGATRNRCLAWVLRWLLASHLTSLCRKVSLH